MLLRQHIFHDKDKSAAYGYVQTPSYFTSDEMDFLIKNILFQLNIELFLKNPDAHQKISDVNAAINIIAAHDQDIITLSNEYVTPPSFTLEELVNIFRDANPGTNIESKATELMHQTQKYLQGNEPPVNGLGKNFLAAHIIYKISSPIEDAQFHQLAELFHEFLQANIMRLLNYKNIKNASIQECQNLILEIQDDCIFMIEKAPGLAGVWNEIMGKKITELNEIQFLRQQIADIKNDLEHDFENMTQTLDELTKIDDQSSPEAKKLANELQIFNNPIIRLNNFVTHVTEQLPSLADTKYKSCVYAVENRIALRLMFDAYIQEYISSVGKVKSAGLFSKHQVKSHLGRQLEERLWRIIPRIEYIKIEKDLSARKKERGSTPKNVILHYAGQIFPAIFQSLDVQRQRWEYNGLDPKDRQRFINTMRALNRIGDFPALSTQKIAKKADELIRKYNHNKSEKHTRA